MKKFLKIILFLIIVISLITIIYFFGKKHIESKSTETSNSDVAEVEEANQEQGMRITLVGGVGLQENGGRNSNSYLIRTKNDELIVVDGGETDDAKFLYNYIMKYGNGTVDHWFITHPHGDHSGAFCELTSNEEYNIKIENLYYNFNPLEWYKQYDDRGYEMEERTYQSLESPKIVNKIVCEKNQIIQIDNIKCEILRIADPKIIHSDNGNDSSMVFKMTAEDVNKSMLFLGDAFIYTSKELLLNPEKLKSFAVQMSHHGQNGVTKEVYDNVQPKLCFFNAPKWLYDNDKGEGYNSGTWKSVEVRAWVDEYGADSVCAFEGDQVIRLTKTGYQVLDENDNVIEEKVVDYSE